MQEAIKLYTMIVEAGIPFAMTFAIGNIVVNTFMRMAFKGKVEIGG